MELINISSESTKTHKLRSLSGNVFTVCVSNCADIEPESNRTTNDWREKKACPMQTNETIVSCNISMCRTNKHIEFIRETPGMELEEQQSFCFHLESCSSTLAVTTRVSEPEQKQQEAYSMLRTIHNCLRNYTHSKKATPLHSLIRRTATYWCKFINFIEANSHYVFKINSTHYVVLHHGLPFFLSHSMFGLSLRSYWCARKNGPDCWAHSFSWFQIGWNPCNFFLSP